MAPVLAAEATRAVIRTTDGLKETMARGRARKRRTRAQKTPDKSGATTGYETELWRMADALRGSMDAAEYKHVVLGLIFLKYISDAFEEMHARLECEVAEGADPEDADEYRAKNIFWVPLEARWMHLKAQAKQPIIGQLVDAAMTAIERDNPALKDVLPKDYARPALDKTRLGQVVDLVSNIKVGGAEARATDVLGNVYEYFLEQFALAEGRKGGEFYTPRSVVRLLVEMLEPFQGRVYDPCCGSSGMFVQSVEFINAHASGNGNGGKAKGDLPAPVLRQAGISIYGQESNYTTWRMARMNLAIRGIEGQIEHGDSFHNDRHPDLKADYILANPPFNVSDWGGERLRDDKRWQYGVPPVRNANYAWVQHFLYHLAPRGTAGFVLANGSMSSNQSGEGQIRKNLIEADLVDCIVALPGQLFRSTQIPACLWFIARDRRGQPSPDALRHPLPEVEGRIGEGSIEEGRIGEGSIEEGRIGEGGIEEGRIEEGSIGEGAGHYRGGLEFSGLLERARDMRREATPAEAFAWELFRDRRFLGLKFRRQHQIGSYVVDLYCHERKLVVELDGPIHDDSQRQPMDARRDAYLKSLDMTIVRIKNESLLDDTGEVLNEIAEAVAPSHAAKGADTSTTELQSEKAKSEILPSPIGREAGGTGQHISPSPSGRGAGVRVNRFRDRRGEILFLDARKLGHMIDRTHRELSPEDISRIADTYHAWRTSAPPPSGKDQSTASPLPPGKEQDQASTSPLPLGEGRGEGVAVYRDISGFCRSATLEDIRKHGHVLTPGRYVGAEPQPEDSEPFEEKMKRLVAQLREQQVEATRLDAAIEENLARLGFGTGV